MNKIKNVKKNIRKSILILSMSGLIGLLLNPVKVDASDKKTYESELLTRIASYDSMDDKSINGSVEFANDINLPISNQDTYLTKIQYANILKSYADYLGYDTSYLTGEDENRIIKSFKDYDDINMMDLSSIAWAYDNGYIDVDSDGKINPKRKINKEELGNYLTIFMHRNNEYNACRNKTK